MDGLNTTFLLGRPIVRGYVSFREGNLHIQPLSIVVMFKKKRPFTARAPALFIASPRYFSLTLKKDPLWNCAFLMEKINT